MIRSLVVSAALAVALAFGASHWPFSGATGSPVAAHVVAFSGAGAAIFFTAIVVAIAWTIRDRPPAFIALGCYAMAAGMTVRIIADPIGLGIAPSVGSAMASLIGMIVAGLWFALAALTADPEPRTSIPPSRAILVVGTLATATLCAGPVLEPSLLPNLLRFRKYTYLRHNRRAKYPL